MLIPQKVMNLEKFIITIVYTVHRNLVICLPLYCRLSVASQNKLFLRILSCISEGSQPEKDLISCRGPPVEPKNERKNPCLLSPWPYAETIFLRLGQSVNKGRVSLFRFNQKDAKRSETKRKRCKNKL
jgi:hypothetical protein